LTASNPVLQALLAARLHDLSTFEKWCIPRQINPLPVAPAYVAAFIRDSQPVLPFEKVWETVQEISRSHLENGLADPTAGGPVAEAINAISRIEPPRSWPKAEKEMFLRLPYDLQKYWHDRSKETDRAVGRAHNEAARARQELAVIQQSTKERTDGNSEINTASA
jgi:hypothetical protein